MLVLKYPLENILIYLSFGPHQQVARGRLQCLLRLVECCHHDHWTLDKGVSLQELFVFTYRALPASIWSEVKGVPCYSTLNCLSTDEAISARDSQCGSFDEAEGGVCPPPYPYFSILKENYFIYNALCLLLCRNFTEASWFVGYGYDSLEPATSVSLSFSLIIHNREYIYIIYALIFFLCLLICMNLLT